MSNEMAMSFVSISIAIVSISKRQLSITFVRSFLNAGEEIHKMSKLDKLLHFACFTCSTDYDDHYRWGQVFILDALSRYKAADPREAENIVERVTPRLQHANCAVVLSAVKVGDFHSNLILCCYLNLLVQRYFSLLHIIVCICTSYLFLAITSADDPSTNGAYY